MCICTLSFVSFHAPCPPIARRATHLKCCRHRCTTEPGCVQGVEEGQSSATISSPSVSPIQCTQGRTSTRPYWLAETAAPCAQHQASATSSHQEGSPACHQPCYTIKQTASAACYKACTVAQLCHNVRATDARVQHFRGLRTGLSNAAVCC
jgi:hypothetical protein